MLIAHSRRPGYIDLSKRRVSPEDIVKCEERYMKSKTVASILRHVASKLPDSPTTRRPVDADAEPGPNEDDRLEQLYDAVAWPLAKKYGHPYDAFKLALTSVFFFVNYLIFLTSPSEPDTVFGSLATPIPAATHALLMATIARRLTPQPIKLRADIELTCYTPSGINAIKKALRAGEKASSDAVPIKAKLVAPPLYVLSTNATDKYAAVERLERAIERIQSTIEDQGGSLLVKMKVILAPLFSCLVLTATTAQGSFRDRRAGSCAAHGKSRPGKRRSIRRRRRRRVVYYIHRRFPPC